MRNLIQTMKQSCYKASAYKNVLTSLLLSSSYTMEFMTAKHEEQVKEEIYAVLPETESRKYENNIN